MKRALAAYLFVVGCAPSIEVELRAISEKSFTFSKVEFTVYASERESFVEAPPFTIPIAAQLVLPEGFEQEPLTIEARAFVGELEVARGTVQFQPGQKAGSLQLAICSNGDSEGIEACDDGNLSSGDGCDSTCKPTGCSSGVATPGELCFASNDDLRGPLGPTQVLAADLDSDGAPDLAAPYPLDGVVRVYPGDGRGVFGAFIEVPVPGVRRLALGDLDQDGTQDLVALSGSAATVLLADGAGGFLARPGPSALGADIVAAELADLNGDEALDLITLDRAQGAISWRPGNSDGTFGGIDPAGQILPVGASPVALALGDLDQEGDLDAVVVFEGGLVRVLLNGPGGQFAQNLALNVEGEPSAVALADFDHNGRTDIAVSKQRNGAGQHSIFLNFENQIRFQANFDAPDFPSSVIAKDFDLDGDLDLAATGESGAVIAVQFNNGFSQFDAPRDASGGIFETREAPISLAAEDLNSDGVPDLVAAGINLGLLLSTP